jgi:hypothetical protein
MKDVKTITIRGEFERAVVFRGGKPQVMQAGKFRLTKDAGEVIYIDTSPQRNLSFGIPIDRGLPSSDKMRFGLNGKIALRIREAEMDIAKFVNKVVARRSSLTNDELIEWLQDGPLPAVLRDITKKATYDEFWQTEREDIMKEVRAKLGAELATCGLELISIDIFEGPYRKV